MSITKKCRYVNLCEFTNTSDCPDILTGCLLCSAQNPKERTFLLVRISARIVVAQCEDDSANHPQGYLCDNMEKNCFSIGIKDLKQYLSFEKNLPKWDKMDEFVKKITQGKILYGLNGDEIDLKKPSRLPQRNRTIVYKINPLSLEIEDGVGTGNFKVAYQTPGEYFEILPEIFKAE